MAVYSFGSGKLGALGVGSVEDRAEPLAVEVLTGQHDVSGSPAAMRSRWRCRMPATCSCGAAAARASRPLLAPPPASSWRHCVCIGGGGGACSGAGQIDAGIKDDVESPQAAGVVHCFVRFFMVALGLVALLFVLVGKLLNGIWSTISKALNLKLKRPSARWCASCAEYHELTGDDGDVWEENGRYYYNRRGLVHDVTDIVQSGVLSGLEDDSDADKNKDKLDKKHIKRKAARHTKRK
eukprot:TRINITY_DN1933_c0_g1_i2.p2 TRINITY_DN1933_c0_g1~~TRINITY_DN1933_c0_g1_i2.p2  ORF type:complete len:238 (+),score=45.19 TRINITY_DN1933_c0_g1_i2:158-871(+)